MESKYPKKGRSWEDIEKEMTEKSQNDLDWQHGRHSAFVWHASEEVEEVARKAYSMFIATNGLGKIVFPSILTMEEEVIAMVLSNMNGEGASGHMTSGGTESIFLAVKAARDQARVERPHITEPEIVAPFSAHPALNKSAHYLGMKVVRVSTKEDFRADVDALSSAVNENTIMVYASAPSFPMGLIDPIAEIGSMAEEQNLWFHVDACVGGILAPFVRKAGYPVPEFDFSIPGVTSISADLHKSGFTAKGASTVLFRSKELQSFTSYTFDEWPSGNYSSLTFTGTNPGGAISAAWAVMNFLGEEGYLELAKKSMESRQQFQQELEKIDGLFVWGEPDLWAIAYGSDKYDIMAIAFKMWEKGWMVAPNSQPEGIHFMITPSHKPVIDEYLEALKDSVNAVAAANEPVEKAEARYS